MDSDAPQGIVALLLTPKKLERKVLAEVFAKVIGASVRAIDQASDSTLDEGDKAAGDFVIGGAPTFIAKVRDAMFLVHTVSTPYMDDSIRASESIPELRLRKAVRDHKAWLSVDIVLPKHPTPQAYLLVLKVLAKLIDDSCLALYHPPTSQFVTCNLGEVISALNNTDPLRAVFGSSRQVPVIPLDEDPRLQMAEEEARRRFAEFELAFHAQDGNTFAIKTVVSGNGNREHIWLEVERIDGTMIEGRLANDPVDLGELKLGSRVEVDRANVEDWIFVRDGEPIGMFTVSVIEQIAKERSLESEPPASLYVH